MDNKICLDCTNFKKVKGEYVCEECFNQLIADLDECPLGITVEELDNINQHAKENKVKIVARADGEKKERKPREKKQDLDKEFLIKTIFEVLQGITEDTEITNTAKIVEFNYNDNHYNIDLIKQRKKK